MIQETHQQMNKKQINEMSTRNALSVSRVVTDFVVCAKNRFFFFFFFTFSSSIFIARMPALTKINLGNNSEILIQYMSRPTPNFSFSHLFFPSL